MHTSHWTILSNDSFCWYQMVGLLRREDGEIGGFLYFKGAISSTLFQWLGVIVGIHFVWEVWFSLGDWRFHISPFQYKNPYHFPIFPNFKTKTKSLSILLNKKAITYASLFSRLYNGSVFYQLTRIDKNSYYKVMRRIFEVYFRREMWECVGYMKRKTVNSLIYPPMNKGWRYLEIHSTKQESNSVVSNCMKDNYLCVDFISFSVSISKRG